ncbi:MAG: GAF domain-containing protein [Candidatus Rokubacteria bacterium]|nr:GAF domain-containing protein [Candidatus Rokubacteria bacterium]
MALLALLTVFPTGSKFRLRLDLGFFGVVGALFASLSFTPLIGSSVSLSPAGIQPIHGPLYPLFAVYISSCFASGFFKFIRQYRRSSGLAKLQLRYLILGLVVPGTLATTTNVLIPLLFGTSRFSKYGPLFSLIVIAMIGHAIIRHRLMDIRVVIRKGVVYIAAFVAAGAILAGLIVGSNRLLPAAQLGMGRDVALGLVVALLFAPLKGRIQRIFDRYLYRETYDYQRTLREASRRMVTTLDLRSLLFYLCEVIGRTARPEMVGIYIRDPDGLEYRLATMQSLMGNEGTGTLPPVPATSGLPALLVKRRVPLVRDDLGGSSPDSQTSAALEDLRRLGAEVVLPILEETRLTGFLAVGAKRSGDPYFTEDLDLLSTLASQAAIAIKNAQLYREVVLVNEYVDNILKTMESGVVAGSVERKVTLFNPAAERMTGLTAASIRSAPIAQLPPGLSALLEATLADGQPRLQVETTLSDGAGRATPVICSTSPLRSTPGDLLGAVLVFSDLTRLKELEREKLRAERLASFGALASGIAHDIKNPLVAIKTFAQLLPKKFAEENFREDFAKIAVREIGRIEGLVERLGDLSRPSEDPLRQLDLQEPIEAKLELLRPQLEDKRIAVRRLYPAAPSPVVGDPARLEQLFMNLFLNALEAMEPGGELTIRLESLGDPGLVTVRVQISDTGPGIPDPLLGKIFDPFVTTRPRGSGLGLAICRAIADAHRATIRAENSPGGRGATVIIEFPPAVGVPEVLKA